MERRRNEVVAMMKKPKWQYSQVGPSPSPRILQLPRRYSIRRNASKGKMIQTQTPTQTPCSVLSQKDQRVKLEVLFHQERSFDRGIVKDEEEEGRRREKVVSGGFDEVDEAKWRFQAEMLRSECNLLRIEKEIALKKMERRKKRMEKTLRSAVHTLLSGKERISGGTKESKDLEEEISYLIVKLNELKSPKVKDVEGGNFRHNFDKQASVLRRELEKFDEGDSEEVCVKGIQQMAEASFLVNPNGNIDTLSSKMEELSREYGSSFFTTSTSCVSQDGSVQDMYNEAVKAHEEKKDCSRHCKVVMRKIAEQVRGEAEQWSQMQEMLNQVRKEMEELQSCRDFWQNRALNSDTQIENLHSSVEGWRRKAISSEFKVKKLQAEVCGLQEEAERLRKEQKLEPEKNKLPSESEKRVLICRLKENRHNNNEGRTTKPSSSRPALREIKNASVTTRHRNTDVMKM